MPGRIVTACVVVALALAAAAAAASPEARLAQRLALRASDLGAGWTTAPQQSQTVDCGLPRGVKRLAQAASPDFKQGLGTYVQNFVGVFRTRGEARAAFRYAVQASTVSCIEDAVRSGWTSPSASRMGFRPRCTSSPCPYRTVAWRLSGSATVFFQPVRVVVDYVAAVRGRAVVLFVFAGAAGFDVDEQGLVDRAMSRGSDR